MDLRAKIPHAYASIHLYILAETLRLKVSEINARINHTHLFLLYYLKNAMIYGYIRVSTDQQTVENQRFEISEYCNKEGLRIDGWIEETISGTKDYNKRRLGKLLRKLKKDDIIICSELSRLGRSLFMILEILSICMRKNCRVWTIKENYRLGDNIESKVLAFAFGLSAELERTLISQRTKEALARKKAEGVRLGRPCGAGRKKLEGREAEIIGMLQQGCSKMEISRRMKVHVSTLYDFMRDNGIKYKA